MAGDELTSLFVNYQWRRIISEGLQLYFDNAIYQLDDADIDDVRNKFQALLNDLYTLEVSPTMTVKAKARRTTNFSILTATGENYLEFDSVDYDSDGFWSALDPTKLTIPTGLDGTYIIMGTGLNQNIAGNRTMSIWKNASREAKLIEVAEVATQGVLTVQLDLVAGDYIRLSFTSSTNSSMIASANDSAWLSLSRLPS